MSRKKQQGMDKGTAQFMVVFIFGFGVFAIFALSYRFYQDQQQNDELDKHGIVGDATVLKFVRQPGVGSRQSPPSCFLFLDLPNVPTRSGLEYDVQLRVHCSRQSAIRKGQKLRVRYLPDKPHVIQEIR